MNAQMMEKIKGLSLQVSQMASEILEQKPCLLHAALNMMDDGQTVRLAGNSEGLVYLASLLLSLAVEQSNNQHVHLGEGEVLDECDKNLILAFQKADWDAP